jgi:AraC-like DNA-binding protein
VLHFLRIDHGARMSGPAEAIAVFERLTGTLVTVHDLDGRLRSLVGGERLAHRHPRCRAAKARSAATCIRFDGERLRQDLPWHPDGLLRTCPAGVAEAVVPCRRDDRLAWVLFAGPVRGDGEDVLEALRQLAARLRLWEDAHAAWPRGPRVERGGAGQPDRRRDRILRWIEEHHREAAGLDDLAAALGLSRFQASRAVRAACGRGFKSLLIAARLATAEALLRDSDLPVVEVAVRAGFADRAHFHRVFRAARGTTPDRARSGLTDV